MGSITNRAAVVMAVVLAGCAGTQPSTPISTPGLTAGQSPEISSTPSAPTATEPAPTEPASTPGVTCQAGAATPTFEHDSIVCVVNGPLGARSKPNTSKSTVTFEPLLQAGQLLFVIDGPVEGSGFPWYLVQDTLGNFERADGWVAAVAEDGTPWLASATVSCPTDPSLEVLASMDAMLRLNCYHAREFTFTDTVVVGVTCGAGGILKSPEWMAGCLSTLSWGRANSGVIVAIPPDLADAVGDVDVDLSLQATITAHMDDPAAQTCVPYEGIEGDYDLINPGTVLACRGMFVATSFERVTP